MSNKETIINEITDLFRTPVAFLYITGPSEYGDVFKVVSWGACKSYLTWPDGAPEGWDDLKEKTEFFVGKSGDRFVTVEVESDLIIKLYTQNDDRITEIAENICWELDLEDDNEWEEVA